MSFIETFRRLFRSNIKTTYFAKSGRVIPITPTKPTSAVVEAFQREYLNGNDLSDWAEALLAAGYDSEAITTALGSAGLHWQRVPAIFWAMCREVGLSEDIGGEVSVVKEEVMIEEYRHGLYSGSGLLFHSDDLRKRVGFPEMIIARINEDAADGTNDSGFYGNSSGMCGEELEGRVRRQLEKVGILRSE